MPQCRSFPSSRAATAIASTSRPEGARLLLDAGISGLQVKRRLALHGRDITRVDAVVISHDHADHCRSMGILHRKFGLTIHVTAKTHKAAVRYGVGKIADVRHFRRGTTLRFGKVAVETIPTPHDGVDGVVFVVDDERRRLGILTDLGHVFSGLEDVSAIIGRRVAGEQLRSGNAGRRPLSRLAQRPHSRPGRPPLERRGRRTSAPTASGRLQWACLAHLSEDNNTPKVAMATHRRIVGRRLPLLVATRHEATDVLDV